MLALSAMSDEALVSRITAAVLPSQVEDAWGELVVRHIEMIRRIVLANVPRDEADDVVGEVLYRFVGKLPSYRGDAPLSHFLARIASNVAADWQRKAYRLNGKVVFFSAGSDDQLAWFESAVCLDPTASVPCDLTPWREFMGDKVQAPLLEAALTGLKREAPGQHQAVTLIYLQEKTYEEASRATGRTVVALKVAVHYGLRQLRERIEPDWKP